MAAGHGTVTQVVNLRDLKLWSCCSIREQRRSVTVLLAGTSGTGKSTLAGMGPWRATPAPMQGLHQSCKRCETLHGVQACSRPD
jgi:adenylylsulfate kinase-like enzyme